MLIAQEQQVRRNSIARRGQFGSSGFFFRFRGRLGIFFPFRSIFRNLFGLRLSTFRVCGHFFRQRFLMRRFSLLRGVNRIFLLHGWGQILINKRLRWYFLFFRDIVEIFQPLRLFRRSFLELFHGRSAHLLLFRRERLGFFVPFFRQSLPAQLRQRLVRPFPREVVQKGGGDLNFLSLFFPRLRVQGADAPQPFRRLVWVFRFIRDLPRARAAFLLAFFADAADPGVEFAFDACRAILTAHGVHRHRPAHQVADCVLILLSAFAHLREPVGQRL